MTKTVIYQDKRLSYQILGTGPTVVLIHGFAEDGDVWINQQSFLQPFFHVIIPHLPGSGSSDVINDMSMEGLAESIYFILNEEGIEQCSMIGHSMGGYVTLAFAEKYVSHLNSFGLFHSTAFADTEEKKLSRKNGIQKIKQNGATSFLKEFVPGLYGPSAKTVNQIKIDDHLKQVAYFTDAALSTYFQSMMDRPDRTNVLKQNKIPVLFVLGRNDTAIPFNDVLQLASMPDISYIHVLEQSGHMGMIEEPEKSNRILNDFLLKTI